jgi:hypothetical protein
MERNSDAADILAIFPNGAERGEIPAVKQMAGGFEEPSLASGVPRVAGADGDVLEHARVAVTIDHAPSAPVANESGLVKFIDVAHGRFPEMATVQIEMPVEVEVLVAAEAPELFLLAAEVPLHFAQGFGRIDHREPAVGASGLDLLENLDEFVDPIVDQSDVAEAEVT